MPIARHVTAKYRSTAGVHDSQGQRRHVDEDGSQERALEQLGHDDDELGDQARELPRAGVAGPLEQSARRGALDLSGAQRRGVREQAARRGHLHDLGEAALQIAADGRRQHSHDRGESEAEQEPRDEGREAALTGPELRNRRVEEAPRG